LALATAIYGFLGLLLASVRTPIRPRALGAPRHDRHLVGQLAGRPTCTSSFPGRTRIPLLAVALFLWYWHETRPSRSLTQWFSCSHRRPHANVYYATPCSWSSSPSKRHASNLRAPKPRAAREPPCRIPASPASWSVTLLFVSLLFLHALPPSSRAIFSMERFASVHPLAFGSGLSAFLADTIFLQPRALLWTPILIFAVAGLVLFAGASRSRAAPFFARLPGILSFYRVLSRLGRAFSSYGNRLSFRSPRSFILGLAVFPRTAPRNSSAPAVPLSPPPSRAPGTLRPLERRPHVPMGSHLIPARGPVSFSEVIHNQFFVIPRQLAADLRTYLFSNAKPSCSRSKTATQATRKKSSFTLSVAEAASVISPLVRISDILIQGSSLSGVFAQTAWPPRRHPPSPSRSAPPPSASNRPAASSSFASAKSGPTANSSISSSGATSRSATTNRHLAFSGSFSSPFSTCWSSLCSSAASQAPLRRPALSCFYFSALVPWTYFAYSLWRPPTWSSKISASITKCISRASFFHFHRALRPRGLLPSGFVVLAIFTFAYGIRPTLAALWLPALLALALFTALGVGLWLSALNALYRDVPLRHSVPRAVLDVRFSGRLRVLAVPARWRWLYGLNPMPASLTVFAGPSPAAATLPASFCCASAAAVVLVLLAAFSSLIGWRAPWRIGCNEMRRERWEVARGAVLPGLATPGIVRRPMLENAAPSLYRSSHSH